MKKVFRVKDLDCANCAAKMEAGINKINGVNSATVNFISQKIVLDAQDDVFEDVVKQMIKVCKKVDSDCTIIK